MCYHREKSFKFGTSQLYARDKVDESLFKLGGFPDWLAWKPPGDNVNPMELGVCFKEGLPVWGCARLKQGAQPMQEALAVRTSENVKINLQLSEMGDGAKLAIKFNVKEPLKVPITWWPDKSVPAINADLIVSLKMVGDDKLDVSVSGEHDQFPSYEIYVGTDRVHGWDTLKKTNGFTAQLALLHLTPPFVNVPVDAHLVYTDWWK